MKLKTQTTRLEREKENQNFRDRDSNNRCLRKLYFVEEESQQMHKY